MKTISANLQTHLDSTVTTIATCWKVTRTDSTVLGFTDHDTDIVYSSVTYYASTGFTPTSLSGRADLSVDNLEVDGVLDSSFITEDDLRNGLYDYATVEVFQINYNSIADGIIKMRKGKIGEVTINRGQFIAELRGLLQHLQQVVGEVYSVTCRADLGDSRCGVNLATYTYSGTVTDVTSNLVFSDSVVSQNDDYYNFGLLTWLTGSNAGLSIEIRDFVSATGTFSLYEYMQNDILVGDTFEVYAGCDKKLSTCLNKFNNVLNFRGEPYVPGRDELLNYPNSN